jgi:copper chaperone CopZ
MRTVSVLRLSAVVLTILALTGLAAADEKPTKTERLSCRVMGLFAPEREQDLRDAFENLPNFKLIAVNFDDAEMTVEFVASKAFPDVKPADRINSLSNQLRNASHNTFSVKPQRTVARDKLKSVEIPVAGLDCKACCLAAYEIVAQIDGVEQATASFKEGRVTALIDPTKTDKTKLEEALRKREVQLKKK